MLRYLRKEACVEQVTQDVTLDTLPAPEVAEIVAADMPHRNSSD